ncbi:PREDICTED: polyadenylate-binding protein-interacting protein 7-like isoform X1 [Ipomoea nil]|uniref:polyadenylate-binding protein-interacting protein 7-like isoform X1 n=1 Tax=Ipomoea nil TaxID=35883 RepID=UPI000901A4A8|nr:PREDICTED: polyadenylate-binding protein-interacting protein 7-like isoform X1 [Ipomoea nil]
MNISGKGVSISDKKLISAKATTLNPNAAEFVPLALKSPSGSTSTAGTSKFANTNTSTLGKAVLDRSESSASNNSDDEAHQYWRRQLPDDITPDFKVMGEDDSHGLNNLPFSSLSLTDITEASRFSGSTGSGFMLKEQQELSPHQISGTSFSEATSYSISPFADAASPTTFHLLPGKPWDKQLMNNGQFQTSPRDGPLYNGNSRHGFLTDGINKQPFVENSDASFEFLSSKFPGFAAESLAEVYYASGGDLALTMDMLTQLELQGDGGLSQNLNSKPLSTSYLSALDFPAPYVTDKQNTFLKYTGDDTQQNLSLYRPSDKDNTLMFRSGSSVPSRGAVDFASAVKKMAHQDSSIWKYDRNGLADASVGSSRNSNAMFSSFNGSQSRGFYGDRLQSRGSTHAGPVWLETGDAVANMYSEIREEARDHAHLRNPYFEQQARQANLIGNKALAKEWNTNGQLHNMQINTAHGKSQESLFRLRNQEIQGNGRGQDRLIDLHGYNVNDALLVLKRELAGLRNAARSTDQQLQVFISVGIGQPTKGSRTPGRLPIAVQCYLLEEGLDYSEPQPGLLRVVMY